jgi:hypothetical protein
MQAEDGQLPHPKLPLTRPPPGLILVKLAVSDQFSALGGEVLGGLE